MNKEIFILNELLSRLPNKDPQQDINGTVSTDMVLPFGYEKGWSNALTDVEKIIRSLIKEIEATDEINKYD